MRCIHGDSMPSTRRPRQAVCGWRIGELALSLDGKKSNFTRLQFERFAAHLGLTTQQRERTERRLLRAAHENLDAVLACSFLSADFQDRLRALVAQRASRLET